MSVSCKCCVLQGRVLCDGPVTRTQNSYHDQQHRYSPSSDGKPEAATAVVVAPDNGHEDARNMLSCMKMTSNKLEKLLHLVG